jgi:nitroimidazol reductase NimA-like FMN-containing flavoprotein (pyridoxamine 5'-phosphate oxidase superfamily)
MLIREMSDSDCQRALTRTRLARLACAREKQPYVVPIYFVYEEPYLYGFTTLGEKVEWMRSNPLVCVELDEVVDNDHWMSIIIFGRYEELQNKPEQERLEAHQPWQRTVLPARQEHESSHAHKLLQEYAGWWEPGCASCTHRNHEQAVTPIFYRIRIDRISGREATPGPRAPVGTRQSLPVRVRQGWLRKVLRTLSELFAGRRATERGG